MSQDDKQEPVYVVDETAHNATPAGMISRAKLVQQGEAPERDEAAADTKVMLFAVIGLIFVVFLGLIGILFNGAQSTADRIEAQIAIEKATAPLGPDDIQGVKVRRGLQHEPNQPAKRSNLQPDEVEEDIVKEVPLNSVPDGGRPEEGAEEDEGDEGAADEEEDADGEDDAEAAAPE